MTLMAHLHKTDGTSLELVPASYVKQEQASIQHWAEGEAEKFAPNATFITIERRGVTAFSGELGDGKWNWTVHA